MEPTDPQLDRPELPPGSDAPTREDLPGADAPPPPRAEEGPRRLLRPRDDRILAGVAGGLGRYFGIDPVLFRLGFIVLVFAGGAGVLAYVLAAILIPSDRSTPRTPWRERAGGGANLVRAGAAVLAVVAVLLLACGVG